MSMVKSSQQMEKVNGRRIISTSMLVKISLLSAIAGVLMVFQLPPVIFPFFLKFEFSDVPAVIGALALGPMAGVLIELIKNLIKSVILGTQTGGVGEVANFAIGAIYVWTLGTIYRKTKKTKKNLVLAMVVSTLVMTVLAGILNYFILIEMYAKFMPMDQIIELSAKTITIINNKSTLVLYGISPFNILKGIIVSISGYYLYIALKDKLKL